MSTQPGLKHRTVVLIVAAMVVLGLLLVFLDWGQVRQVLMQANWEFLLLALFFTAISLGCLAASYALVVRIFGVAIELGELFRVGLISNILNHLLPTGGAGGYSLGLALAGRRGYSLSDMVGASLRHGYISSIVMMAMLPVGLLYLAITHPLSPRAAWGVVAAAVILVALMVFLTALVIRPPLRTKVLSLLARIWRRLSKRDIGNALDTFDQTMTRGVDAMRAAPSVAWSILALSIGDLVATLATVHYCFRALGPAPSLGVLATGFIIGVAAGTISLIPGGLGVQEGSMAGMYHLLGVPLEQAALAAILFRAIYFLIPFVLTLPLYGRVLRTSAALGREPPDGS
jgi:uncharacterized protein (TIRG00374 family)